MTRSQEYFTMFAVAVTFWFVVAEIRFGKYVHDFEEVCCHCDSVLQFGVRTGIFDGHPTGAGVLRVIG